MLKQFGRSPPTFNTLEEQRKYQKEHLAAAFRVFAKQGFDEGVAGHISLRDPINHGATKSQSEIARSLANLGAMTQTNSGLTLCQLIFPRSRFRILFW